MKKNRLYALLLAGCMVCGLMTENPAFAWNWSQERLSPSGTAGSTFYSPTITLSYPTSIYSSVSGGDVKAGLYEGLRGMQESFYRTTSRLATANLQEMDGTTPLLARTYTAYFVIGSSDYYHPGTWTNTYTYTNIVESDGNVELRMAFYISTHAADTSASVPANLFSYDVAVID